MNLTGKPASWFDLLLLFVMVVSAVVAFFYFFVSAKEAFGGPIVVAPTPATDLVFKSPVENVRRVTGREWDRAQVRNDYACMESLFDVQLALILDELSCRCQETSKP